MNNRLPGLDGIRALSITAVIVAHVGESSIPLTTYGRFGVDIFFVLSGFLITHLLCLEDTQQRSISLLSFYVRRALRILPPAFLCIAATSAMALVGWASLGINEAMYAAFFVRNLMPNAGLHLTHFWTLAIEEQFYLVWPLTFIFLGSNRKRLALAIAIFAAAPFYQHLLILLAGGAMHLNWARFDLKCQPLVAGCSLALLSHTYPHLLKGPLQSSTAAFLSVVAIVAGCAGLPHRAFGPTLASIGVCLFINCAIKADKGRMSKVLNSAVLVWLGQLSYSLYLWQEMFCVRSQIPWLSRFPQNVLASVLVACLSFYLVEKPLFRLRARVPYLPNPDFGLLRSKSSPDFGASAVRYDENV